MELSKYEQLVIELAEKFAIAKYKIPAKTWKGLGDPAKNIYLKEVTELARIALAHQSAAIRKALAGHNLHSHIEDYILENGYEASP